ncbi:MAG: hypothetical protein AAFY57_19970, partial [Cyanobacteria bacterium J06642_2]
MQQTAPAVMPLVILRSLRLKFTLALLATSLVAVTSVGVTARWMMFRQFSQVSVNESFERFQADVTR